jgi:hypothetical protein
MSAHAAVLANLVAAGPSTHEGTSFTAYATLPLSGLKRFRRNFGIQEDLPRDGVAWEPPVVLMTARWPAAGETHEAVIAEAMINGLAAMAVDGRMPPELRARLIQVAAAAPAQPAREHA